MEQIVPINRTRFSHMRPPIGIRGFGPKEESMGLTGPTGIRIVFPGAGRRVGQVHGDGEELFSFFNRSLDSAKALGKAGGRTRFCPRCPVTVADGHLKLEVEHLGFGGQVDQMRTTVHDHVRREFCLVNLTGIRTRNSDADGDLMFDQIRKVIVGAVTRGGFCVQVSCGISPQYTVVNEEDICLMTFGVGNLRKLETSGGRFVVVTAQCEQKVRHNRLQSC